MTQAAVAPSQDNFSAPTRDAAMVFPEISVVIPTLNEGKNIGPLVERIRRVLTPLVPAIEILVVDGGSKDETWQEAERAGARCLLQRRIGYGGALRDGLQAARGEFVITLDSDLSHPPELMTELWKRRDEADVIIASRFVKGGSSQAPLFRHLLSITLNTVFSTVLSVPIKDSSSGYRLYRRAVLRPDLYRPENFNVLQEIIIRAFVDGWRVTEIPLVYEQRAHGTSKVSLVKFALSYVPTLTRLWILRNAASGADYEHRAYDSRHGLQRYWVRKRCRTISEFIGPSERLADLGSGSSRFTTTHQNAVALDQRIDKLRFLRRSNARAVQAQIEKLPWASGSFDAAVMSQVLGATSDVKAVLKEANRILKPNGTLVISVPDSRRLGWRIIGFLYRRLPNVQSIKNDQELSRGMLVDLLAASGFRSLKYRYIMGAELILKAQKVESI